VNATLGLNLNTGGTVVDSSGNIFISDTTSEAVRRVDAASESLRPLPAVCRVPIPQRHVATVEAATSAALNFPGGLALDQNRNLFIADTDDSRVRRVAVPTGIISTVAGNGTFCPDSTTPCGDGGIGHRGQLGRSR